MQRFLVKRLSMNNLNKIKHFITEHYTPREPLTLALKAPIHEAVLIDQLRVERNLHHNAAVGVVLADTGKLIAVNVSYIESEEQPFQTKHLDAEIKKLTAQYEWLRYINRLEDCAMENLRQELGAGKILMVSLGTVDVKYSKCGLLTKMICEDETTARELGCDFLAAFCSSNYSMRATLNRGFTSLTKVNLLKYADKVSGTMAFSETQPPHTECCCVYKKNSRLLPTLL